MKFHPTPLAYSLGVVLAWALFLGVALGRPEPFCAALPLLIALLRGAVRCRTTATSVELSVDALVQTEQDELTATVTATVRDPSGPVQLLLVLPPFVTLLNDRAAPVFKPAHNVPMTWCCRLRCDASGVLEFRSIFLRAWDWSGLWSGEWHHEQRILVSVHPRSTRVRCMLTPRHTGAPFGAHASPLPGEGIEFADIRPFVPGDRMRQINWPVSLRRRELHTNRQHTDRQATVILLIDTFTVVGARPNSSLDHVLRAAAGLAAAYLQRYDRVGVIEYGGVARSAGAATGQHQYQRILDGLSRSAPVRTEFVQDLATLPDRVLPRRALVIALTPLADERFERAVARLADTGRDIVVLALRTDKLSESLLRRSQRQDLVRRLWALDREDHLAALRRHGIRAVNWSPDLPFDAALRGAQQFKVGRQSAWHA